MGNGEAARHDEEPAGVAHHSVLFLRRTHHKARGVAERNDGQVEGIAQLHKARGLIAAYGVDGTGKVGRIVGDEAHGLALDTREAGDHAHSEFPAQLEYGALVRGR